MTFNQNLSTKKKLFSDLESNIYIAVSRKENLKSLNFIDFDTKAKLMFNNSTLFPNEKQTKFRKDSLKFYLATVQHLQSKLSLGIPFVNMHSSCIPKGVSFLMLQVLYQILHYQFVLFIKLASKMFPYLITSNT